MTWETVLLPPWLSNPPSSDESLKKLSSWADLPLPDDYLALLRWANGGEGPIGDVYLSIWPCEDVSKLNEGYRIQTHLPGVMATGDDGAHFYALAFEDAVMETIRFPIGFVHAAAVESRKPTLFAMFESLMRRELH